MSGIHSFIHLTQQQRSAWFLVPRVPRDKELGKVIGTCPATSQIGAYPIIRFFPRVFPCALRDLNSTDSPCFRLASFSEMSVSTQVFLLFQASQQAQARRDFLIQATKERRAAKNARRQQERHRIAACHPGYESHPNGLVFLSLSLENSIPK